MKWDTLFSMQKELDRYIIENNRLESQDLFEQKMLALFVELGELANEARTFKFWSNKAPSAKNIILEEYVDNIHFILSIGLEKGYTFTEMERLTTNKNETLAFNHTFSSCLAFYEEQTEANYQKMFKHYLQLADVLGFQETEIMEAYHSKNAVNYERQENGY